MEKFRTIGIYCRQSRERENSASIETQAELGIKKSKELNCSYEIYEDRDTTAITPNLDNRPGIMKLLNDIQKGVITDVFAYDESRISRSEETKLLIKSIFKENNVTLYTELDGKINFNNGNDEFLSGIRLLFNQKYIRDTSEKLKSTLKVKASNGVFFGVMIPYGYTKSPDKKLIVDPEESKIIQLIYDLSLKGHGVRYIASHLDRLGVKTRGNKVLKNGIKLKNRYTKKESIKGQNDIRWAPNTLLNILKNPIYKGERKYKGETFVSPIIIDPKLWEEVNKNLTKNHKTSKRNQIYQYLLKGLIRCKRCNSNYYGVIKAEPKDRTKYSDYYYMCSSKRNTGSTCKNRSINIKKIEEIIWYAVINGSPISELLIAEINSLKNPEVISNLRESLDQVQKQIGHLNNSKTTLFRLMKNGAINEDDLNSELKKIGTELGELTSSQQDIEGKLMVHQNQTEVIDQLKEFQDRIKRLPTLDFHQKYEIVKTFVKEILIDFDETTQHFSVEVLIHYKREHFSKGVFNLGKNEEPNLLDHDLEKDKWSKKLKKGVKMKTSHLPHPVPAQRPKEWRSMGEIRMILNLLVKIPKYQHKVLNLKVVGGTNEKGIKLYENDFFEPLVMCN
jgi:hypothetical protein